METKLTVKDSALSFMLGFFFCQLGAVATSIITMFVCSFLKMGSEAITSFMNKSIGYTILSVGMYFAMFLVFLFFNNKKENKITEKFSFRKLLLYILIALVSFLVLYPVVTCIDTILNHYNIKINVLPFDLTQKSYFISLISLVILPAICEELLFRGIILKGLKKHGKAFSILISAIMFSIFHMAISQTVYPLLMGILLGVIMYNENNIYYCIAVHMANNFTSLTLSYLKISLVFNHWSYWILAAFALIIFTTIILVATFKNNKEKAEINSSHKKILTLSLTVMLALWILVNFI